MNSAANHEPKTVTWAARDFAVRTLLEGGMLISSDPTKQSRIEVNTLSKVPPRALTRDECAKLYDVIIRLVRANLQLHAHALEVSKWSDRMNTIHG